MLLRTRRSRPLTIALGSESAAGLEARGVSRYPSGLDVTVGVARKVRAVVNDDVEAVDVAGVK